MCHEIRRVIRTSIMQSDFELSNQELLKNSRRTLLIFVYKGFSIHPNLTRSKEIRIFLVCCLFTGDMCWRYLMGVRQHRVHHHLYSFICGQKQKIVSHRFFRTCNGRDQSEVSNTTVELNHKRTDVLKLSAESSIRRQTIRRAIITRGI